LRTSHRVERRFQNLFYLFDDENTMRSQPLAGPDPDPS